MSTALKLIFTQWIIMIKIPSTLNLIKLCLALSLLPDSPLCIIIMITYSRFASVDMIKKVKVSPVRLCQYILSQIETKTICMDLCIKLYITKCNFIMQNTLYLA